MATNDAAEDSLDSLDLKKRARRRLVGAAALALLAVIVLPVVMDSEPKPVAQDIQVRIPSQDGVGLATKVLPNKTLATPLPAVQEKSPETPAPVLAAANAASETVKSESKSDTKSEAKTDTKAKPETKAAEKPVDKAKADKPQDKSTDKAGADKTVKKAEEARAAAALEGKASSSGQWVVQLGAYQNTGNVKLLLSKLKELGVPAYTEKLDSQEGAKIRVRAGPFPSKEAAEKAQTRIKIIGVDGPVGQK
ncbi:MAG TPA: SPOR domain-containing protein [Rhodocyclaceae bacterium]|jgi:DedD protein